MLNIRSVRLDSQYNVVSCAYYIEWADGDGYCSWDREVAEALGITTDQYRSILHNHRAAVKENGEVYFHSQEGAQVALAELEPYVIMKQLSES